MDWTVVRGVDGKFTRAARSSAGASEHAGRSHVDDEPPQGSRRAHHPSPGGPTYTRLIPSYGGHITKVIFDGSERTPPVLECRSRKKPLKAIMDSCSSCRILACWFFIYACALLNRVSNVLLPPPR